VGHGRGCRGRLPQRLRRADGRGAARDGSRWREIELSDVSSSFAMEQIKYTTALPLSYA
jgi:hypothetical protein